MFILCHLGNDEGLMNTQGAAEFLTKIQDRNKNTR